ncbi:MAG: substrate-binding domain-containing protein [Clostridiaceae bacterium]|nr:substrate-binding domain-containing protein [Clostridiaceae bacterium]
MKKLLALLLAIVMIFALMACAKTKPSKGSLDDDNNEDALSEEQAWKMAQAGTLISDARTGYEKSEQGTWYYSNYPNYKDFKADDEVKVAFICKFSGAWFSPKEQSLGQTLKAAGYTYQFFDCNADTQLFMDYVQNAINQEFDVVILTPPNTTLLAEALALLQEEGIAYMTTDDPGPDSVGFYAPHYGLDDYALHNELGKACAAELKSNGWLDGINDDWSNFEFLVCDIPTVESVHLRNQGFCDAIVEELNVPENRVVWLDISASDALQTKFGATLQNESATVDKWIISNGSGGVAMAIPIAQELNMNMDNIIWSDCFSDPSTMTLMLENPSLKANCWGVGLVYSSAGVGVGEVIIDLVENGTPIPCFTPYALNVVNKDTVEEFYNTHYGNSK